MAIPNKRGTTKSLLKKTILKKPRIKRGDTVMVITGKDKGKTGVVQRINVQTQRVIVEGRNMVKKSVKPNPGAGIEGGIVPVEAGIHISNLMLVDLKTNTPTRVRRVQATVDGKTVVQRIAVKTGAALE